MTNLWAVTAAVILLVAVGCTPGNIPDESPRDGSAAPRGIAPDPPGQTTFYDRDGAVERIESAEVIDFFDQDSHCTERDEFEAGRRVRTIHFNVDGSERIEAGE